MVGSWDEGPDEPGQVGGRDGGRVDVPQRQSVVLARQRRELLEGHRVQQQFQLGRGLGLRQQLVHGRADVDRAVAEPQAVLVAGELLADDDADRVQGK
jgi:hypothetical protein